jgi:hypothetical protein
MSRDPQAGEEMSFALHIAVELLLSIFGAHLHMFYVERKGLEPTPPSRNMRQHLGADDRYTFWNWITVEDAVVKLKGKSRRILAANDHRFNLGMQLQTSQLDPTALPDPLKSKVGDIPTYSADDAQHGRMVVVNCSCNLLGNLPQHVLPFIRLNFREVFYRYFIGCYAFP